MFTAKDVMTLRELTGAGMMDCKKALTECDGDMEKAKDFLREKGLAAAAKKAGRIAAEGIVDSYIHLGGKIGVLVEVNCETDFGKNRRAGIPLLLRAVPVFRIAGHVKFRLTLLHFGFLQGDDIRPRAFHKRKKPFVQACAQAVYIP